MGVIGDILRVIGIILMVVMVFNLLIIVHEWGHFLAARWRGLMVDRFQIWFGKPIWKKKINGVQYGLGSIPAGGFVSLPQMAPMGAIEGQAIDDENGEADKGAETEIELKPENLPPITPLDKIIVAFAGPLFSFLLAVVFACIVWIVGKPEAQMAQTKSVGYASPGSPSAEAGFQPGDEIVSVGGKEIARFHGLIDSVDWNYITSSEKDVPVVINRPGTGEMTLTLEKDLAALRDPNADKRSWWKRTVAAIFSRSALPDTGLRGAENPMIGQVSPNGPAAVAGLQSDDVILKIDGIDVKSRFFITDYINEHPGKSLELEIRRDGKTITKSLTPRIPENIPADWPEELREEYSKKPLAGIGWDEYGISTIAHPKPGEQVASSLRVIVSTLKAVGQKGTGVNAGHLSGPVGIMRLYYRLFQHPDGWRLVLWFSVVLNINLAVLNMLPLPVLDGGHITMALIEWITRKPINFRVLEVVQTACVVLLLGFMGFVTLKDAGDLFGGGSKETISFDAPAGAETAAPEE